MRYQTGLAVALLTGVSLTGAAQAPAVPSGAGVVATGTVTLQGPRGLESGAITVSAWGEHYCKISIQLGAPQDHRFYTATLNGKRVSVSAPQGLAEAAPLPLSPAIGCALVPEALALDHIAQGSATLAGDAMGRPAALSWKRGSDALALTYQYYQSASGTSYAAALTETVAGETRLTVQITSVTAQNFSANDFPLPALNPALKLPPTHGYPAGAQAGPGRTGLPAQPSISGSRGEATLGPAPSDGGGQ